MVLNDSGIYTINPGGGGKTKVAVGQEPSYSPDGKRIAYSGYDGNDSEICTINVGGGGKSQVTNTTNSCRQPFCGRRQRLLPPRRSEAVGQQRKGARNLWAPFLLAFLALSPSDTFLLLLFTGVRGIEILGSPDSGSHRSTAPHQHSEPSHTLSQGSASC